ncbi:unnamed protein product [Paramecium sonneborni]|uniref:Uncharacterized protein n=1 Tax=Paramecium sonneborni TaxID=65129 RepID=A0A8S1RTW8_9CILI|nr:unnamed protein product [Paramecium sonneborni]
MKRFLFKKQSNLWQVKSKCLPVLSVYYQVQNKLIKNNLQKDSMLFLDCYQITKKMIEDLKFNQTTIEIQQIMGHILLTKQQISFLVKLDHLNKSNLYLEQLITNQVQKIYNKKNSSKQLELHISVNVQNNIYKPYLLLLNQLNQIIMKIYQDKIYEKFINDSWMMKNIIKLSGYVFIDHCTLLIKVQLTKDTRMTLKQTDCTQKCTFIQIP